MITSLQFWYRLSVLLLGLWGFGWAISVAWRRRRENGVIDPIVTTHLRLKQITRTSLTNMAKVGLGIVLGMATIDLWEYHHTYVVTNAVIDAQQGTFVAYHFEHDQRIPRVTYAWKFCDDYVPDFEPRQIVETMVYVRKPGCESIAPYRAELRLRRDVYGNPILEKGGE